MENNYLEEKLRAYASSDAYAFHMPGHKRICKNLLANGADAYMYDITEIDGFDNLHDPSGILAEEMAFAANVYGTRRTHFLVGGSTLGMLVAISAAVPKGGHILIERGCHISVYHAAHLRELSISYIPDPWEPAGILRFAQNDNDGILCFAQNDNDGILRFAQNDKVAAIVLTSPTYEGAVRPVAAWAAFARRIGAVLIVDEAHGAHLPFHPSFPPSAISQGADIVVQSLHKTLPALTQTALLHEVTGRVDSRRIQEFLDIYETSSPSYLLLSSITATLHALAGGQACHPERSEGSHQQPAALEGICHPERSEGSRQQPAALEGTCHPERSEESPQQLPALEGTCHPERSEGSRQQATVLESTCTPVQSKGFFSMAAYVTRLRILRARLSRLHNFSLLGGEEANTRPGEFPGIPAQTPLDPGKIVLICRGQMDGPALYGCLRENYRLQPEMCGPGYVLCITSVADTDEGFSRLAEAMGEIDVSPNISMYRKEREKKDSIGEEKRKSKIFANKDSQRLDDIGEGLEKSNNSARKELRRQDIISKEPKNSVLEKRTGGELAFANTTLPPVACPIYEAAEAPREAVPLEEANGRVAAAYVLLYPPDAPLIIPGEVFTAEKIREIQEYLRLGFSVPGIETGERVWVTYAD